MGSCAPGSDFYVFAQGVANELEVVESNAIVKADDQMPDSAEGPALYRLCEIYGLALQAAAGSAGPGTLLSSASTTIAAGQVLTDSSGLRYRVLAGGTFASGESLNIEAIDLGASTNNVAGDILRWQTSPAFADEMVTVGLGGLVNGHDAENDEGLRARLLARLRNPPRSGNWEHVAELAEQSSSNVEKAFVYPALQGAGTLHVAVTAAPTATSKLRTVNVAIMSGTVVPYVQGQLPEHAYIVTTTVVNVPAEVSLGVVLPEAPTASPPGPGGGWLDGTPWPDTGALGRGCRITLASGTSTFTVDALLPPTSGVSRVMWVNRATWSLHSAKVVSFSGVPGAYVVVLDVVLPGALAGDFIFPASVNAQVYLDAIFGAFAAMGPGEKTANVSNLVRGFRRPRPSNAWPYSLGSQMTKRVVDSSLEITDAQFLYRNDGITSLSTSTGSLVPQVPAGGVTAAPNIFVPSNIGIYRAT